MFYGNVDYGFGIELDEKLDGLVDKAELLHIIYMEFKAQSSKFDESDYQRFITAFNETDESLPLIPRCSKSLEESVCMSAGVASIISSYLYRVMGIPFKARITTSGKEAVVLLPTFPWESRSKEEQSLKQSEQAETILLVFLRTICKSGVTQKDLPQPSCYSELIIPRYFDGPDFG